MKILITGGKGMLGRTLQHELADHEIVERVLADEGGELGTDQVVVRGGFRGDLGEIGIQVQPEVIGLIGVVVAGLERDLQAGMSGGGERLGNEVAVIFQNHFGKEIIGGAEYDLRLVYRDRHHFLEPLLVHCFGLRPDESDC